jgi:flagellar hook-associated protein 1 FlgK
MRSTFGGLETTLRAIQAQRLALDLTGHNIANTDTPGYSRQVARTSATAPYCVPTMNRNTVAGQIGTGVEIDAIERMRDEFLDRQLQYENSSLGWWTTRQSGLEQLEVIFQEPSETGLAAQLNNFWSLLQDLSVRPDDANVRTPVLETAENLADTIRHTYHQLENFQKNLDQEARVLVERINSLATKIAQLNKEIVQVVGVGQNPNDLLDERELLVQELSEITDINVQTNALNSMTVSIGGTLLVSGDNTYHLRTVDDATTGFAGIVTTINGSAVDVRRGKLASTLELRDVDVNYYKDSLDSFTRTLIDEFNAVHSSGYGLNDDVSRDFFGGDSARNITVLITNPRDIAASSVPGSEGNGLNAIELARIIKDTPHATTNNATLSSFYGAMIAKLGVDADKADTALTNQTMLVNHLFNRQQSVAGVSLDEEMANMIKFQHSYNAAARMMTTIDETLDRIINGMGIVGR